MDMGSPTQSTKPDYTYSLGPDLINKTMCEYWQTAPYYAPTSKGMSDQHLVVQDEAHAAYVGDL